MKGKIESWQLAVRKQLPLEIKETMTLNRIRAWHEHFEGDVYISFSGGVDSTVLLHLVRRLFPDVPGVFIDTGLEFPEIRKFVKTHENIVWLKPQMRFDQVLDHYGYPIISKEQSSFIEEYRKTKSDKLRDIRWNGNKWGQGKISNKWKSLVYAPFKISSKCCKIMKKNPVEKYEKETGRKGYIGVIADESSLRNTDYLRYGCSSFDAKRPLSRPLGFWTKQDIQDYIEKYNIPYSSIYDMGYERTGCVFCMYGVNQEGDNNRFTRLEETHPKLHDYCMNNLGLAEVLDYIDVKHSSSYSCSQKSDPAQLSLVGWY